MPIYLLLTSMCRLCELLVGSVESILHFTEKNMLILNRLNSRDSLREQAAPQDGTFLQLTPFRAMASSHNPSNEPSNSTDPSAKNGSDFVDATHLTLAVKIQKQTISKTDYD